MSRITDNDLRQAAAFLRGKDAGADVKVLANVAAFLDRAIRQRELNRGKARASAGKAPEQGQEGVDA
jgi:hypothetical protein